MARSRAARGRRVDLVPGPDSIHPACVQPTSEPYPALLSFLRTFENHVDGEPELIELMVSCLEERTDVSRLPSALWRVWRTTGQESQPAVFPMLRVLAHESATYTEPPLDEWLRILDGLRLLGPDQVLNECERGDLSSLDEVDPSWVPLGTGGSNLAYLDGDRLIVWNHAPWDEPLGGRGHTDTVFESLEERLAQLEASVARGDFEAKEYGPGWQNEPAILYQGRLMFMYEWAAMVPDG